MTNKDFLSQFSSDNKKPDSFKEEERKKVSKEKKPINIKILSIIIGAALLVVAVVLFIVFRPTIEVKNFVGLDASEAKAWIKQNEIETQGIIFREEYNFDYDDGYIISQSIAEGKKVRKNVKMDFVVSQGADPDEIIFVPDIENMNKEEIQQWIKDNKLQKTKITTSYNDDVAIGEVISFEFKGVDPDSFTRSSTLNINVSKGPQPAGTVTVEDFVKQDFSIVEAWGKKNKIDIVKTTKYDEKVLKDIVISQSIEAKKTMKQGESLTVVVSLGKGVIVPDFSKMTESEIDEWAKDNAAYIKLKEIHSEEDSYIVKQSIATGKFIGEDSKLELTINLGDHFYLDEIGMTLVGSSYDKFKDLADGPLMDKGINIDTHKTYVNSDKPKGTILGIEKIYSGKDVYSEVQRLPLEVDITCRVSDGSGTNMFKIPYEDFIIESDPVNLSVLDGWILEHGEYGLKYKAREKNAAQEEPWKDSKDVPKDVGIINIYISNDGEKDIKSVDGYLSYGSTIYVTYSEE